MIGPSEASPQQLVDHLFRHEAGKMIAVLTLLQHHYIYSAVLGDLYGRAGNAAEARRLLEMACHLTSSLAEKKLLQEKLGALP